MIKFYLFTIKYSKYYKITARSQASIHKLFTKSLLAINNQA